MTNKTQFLLTSERKATLVEGFQIRWASPIPQEPEQKPEVPEGFKLELLHTSSISTYHSIYESNSRESSEMTFP